MIGPPGLVDHVFLCVVLCPVAQSLLDLRSSVRDFVDWCDAGFAEAGLSPNRIDVKTSSHAEVTQLRLIASNNFTQGETVFQAPDSYYLRAHRSLAATPFTHASRSLGRDFHAGDAAVAVDAVKLATVLAEQLHMSTRGYESAHWRPFLKLLPGKLDDLPEFWIFPRQTSLFSRLDGRAGAWQLESEAAAARVVAGTSIPVDPNTALLAVHLTRSRAAWCPGMGLVLHPAVSLTNHAGSSANLNLDLSDCSLRAAKPVQQGDDLSVNYGQRPCINWLMSYGFVPEDEGMDSERVVVSLPRLQIHASSRGISPTYTNKTPSAHSDFNASIARADQLLRCTTDMVLPPCSEYSGGSTSKATLRKRLCHCLWLRVLSVFWPSMRPSWFATGVDKAPIEPQDWPQVVSMLLAPAFGPRTAELREVAVEPSPWVFPTDAQRSWWSSVQRCASRQVFVLESYIEYFNSGCT